jgi:hypothetical protein
LNIPLFEQGERNFVPMREYTHEASDIKTLIGPQLYTGYQQQGSEAVEANEYEFLICYFCSKQIEPDQSMNLHHPLYKSNGGTEVEPAHEKCHIEFHSRQGDFREFGNRSAMTRAWAWNLKNVRTHPAFEFDRQYYLMLYGK